MTYKYPSYKDRKVKGSTSYKSRIIAFGILQKYLPNELVCMIMEYLKPPSIDVKYIKYVYEHHVLFHIKNHLIVKKYKPIDSDTYVYGIFNDTRYLKNKEEDN